ncbi:UNVERIFIED_CONTAM: hypothetical protein Slati_0945000 [Sesamum latifolium]|uniref:Uncharacterized protein n=1 Tax=Sesamum latifolium TaxID=2727402 RepID=A0AAW2XPH2_9LAMI
MEIPSNIANKQKAVETPGNTQALQVIAGTWHWPPQHPWHQRHPFKICRSYGQPPTTKQFLRHFLRGIFPALLGAIQRIVSAAI